MNPPMNDRGPLTRGRELQPMLGELAACKRDFLSALSTPTRPAIAVIGNEAGDMDSCVGALCEALLLRETAKGRECVFPVLPLTHQELRLRRDIMLLFEKVGITPDEHLIFIDQAELPKFYSEGRLHLLLVDHNKPEIALEQYNERVVGAIDHHAPSNFPFKSTLIDQPLRVNSIKKAGSACSLICDQARKGRGRISNDWCFAALLEAAIKLDTEELRSNVTTELDRDALSFLAALTRDRAGIPSYQELLAARRDTSGMTPQELMARDRKWFRVGEVTFGISSLPHSISQSSEMEGGGLFGMNGAVTAHLQSKIGEAFPRLFFLHCSFEGPHGFSRETALCFLTAQAELGHKVGAFLRGVEGVISQETQYSGEGLEVMTFTVPAELSRKRLSPLVEKFLRTQIA